MPEAGRQRREEIRQREELQALVQLATDEQISRLPESYQAIVKMLKMINGMNRAVEQRGEQGGSTRDADDNQSGHADGGWEPVD